MVRVIERREEAGESVVVELKVFVRRDPNTVHGQVKLPCLPLSRGPGGSVEWERPVLKEPVVDAYRQALRLAQKHGFPFVWVNDPEGLFPPDQRPFDVAGGVQIGGG